MTEIVYDDTKNKECRKYAEKIGYAVFLMNAVLLIFVLFIYSISDREISELDLVLPVIILIAIVIFVILNIKELRAERKGTMGFRVDSNGLYIGNVIKNITLNKKKIEFVYIDLYYQTLFVKTTRKPKIRITENLFKNPKTFISKIPQRDMLFYNHSSRAIANIPEFIKALKHYDIDVYFRDENENIIRKR